MRNIFPSSLFTLSLLLSGSAFMLLAAVEGNPASGKAQGSLATTATGTAKPAESKSANPVQTNTISQQQIPVKKQGTGQIMQAGESSPKLSASLKPEPLQKTSEAVALSNEELLSGSTGAAKTSSPQPAKPPSASKEEKKNPPAPVTNKIDPFTGKITKNKVRIRLQPAFDGAVLRELNLNDLIVVVGEVDDFYAIQPPADVKAYVYRTFVLDNVIEGNRVNARLKPDLEAPVVVQLNTGDHVEGVIHPANNKWMEIKLPEATRFYVAKEYVAKAGDAGYKARLEKKHEEAIQLLNTTEGVAKAEMQKSFDQINIEGIKTTYQHLMKDYPEFPEIAVKAKEALASLLETYTTRKLAYLETQTRSSANALEANKKLAAELQAQKSKVNQLEQQIEQNRQIASAPQMSPTQNVKHDQLPINMSAWLPVEENIMARWSQQTGKHNPNDFYEEQKKQGFVLKGVIDPYNRPVQNKPGDYMLLNSSSKLPIAFLYSTIINLQDYVGHEVSVIVSPRTNNHFAFPAYFVLQLE